MAGATIEADWEAAIVVEAHEQVDSDVKSEKGAGVPEKTKFFISSGVLEE